MDTAQKALEQVFIEFLKAKEENNVERLNGQWKIYQFDHMPCFDRIPFEEEKYLY